jgi:hypothetical protein
MHLFLFAALLAAAVAPSWSDPLPAAVTSVTCISASTGADDPSACAIGGANGASASVVRFPIVAIQARASSAGADVVQAFSGLQYSFEVVGGKLGDLVPVPFVAELAAFASSDTIADGQASITALNSQNATLAMACVDTRVGVCPTPFLGQFSVNVSSGRSGTAEHERLCRGRKHLCRWRPSYF